jgi:hypothetical protein
LVSSLYHLLSEILLFLIVNKFLSVKRANGWTLRNQNFKIIHQPLADRNLNPKNTQNSATIERKMMSPDNEKESSLE